MSIREEGASGSTGTADQAVSTGSASSTDTTAKAGEAASRVADSTSAATRQAAQSQFEQSRDVAAGQLDSASATVGDVAETLEQDGSPFASYASELSTQLSSFSSRVSNSSLDEMIGGARTLARDNPAAFMLGSVAIGLAASRFFKAAGEEVLEGAGNRPSDAPGNNASEGRAPGSTSPGGNPSAGTAPGSYR